jgi:branched-chain amino acid transport system ATP-binding protein
MPLLELRGLHAWYGARPVVRNLDLTVKDGEIVALLGANGAGKTTTLRAISGLTTWSGAISIGGRSLRGLGPSAVARLGVSHVPEGHGIYGQLSVWENLRLGVVRRRDGEVAVDLRRALERWPALAVRRTIAAGMLSGGEQQQLALARAMLARPRLLLLDEPSLGLAPRAAAAAFAEISRLSAERGTAVLLVEQNVGAALAISQQAYVLRHGELAAHGPSATLADNPAVRAALVP